jgi:hypothetical protein
MRNAAIVLFMISFGLLMAPSFACPSKHQKVSDPDNMPSPAVGRSLWREGAKDHGFWHEGIWTRLAGLMASGCANHRRENEGHKEVMKTRSSRPDQMQFPFPQIPPQH